MTETILFEMSRVDVYVMSWSSPIRLARRISMRAVERSRRWADIAQLRAVWNREGKIIVLHEALLVCLQ